MLTDNVLLLQHSYETPMPQNVKITIIQTDIKWASPKDNIISAEAMLDGARQSDLYVLPEMWATGFGAPPTEACTTLPLEWMRRTAAQRQCAICGSLAAKAGDGTLRNRLYFVRPDSTMCFYDKHHLFACGGEDRHYTPGSKRTVAEYMGTRFLLLTCYDLRFPVWARYRGDYDAIILAANWPESRQHAWQTLTCARAIENQCYVIAANRTGSDPTCRYAGGSAVIDPKGRITAQADGRGQQTVTAHIDTGALREFRTKFPVLEDRDTYFLEHNKNN